MQRPRPPYQPVLRFLSPLVLACAVVISLVGAAALDMRPEGALSERVAQSVWLVEDAVRTASSETSPSGDDLSGALHTRAARSTRPTVSGRRCALAAPPLPDPRPAHSSYTIRAPPCLA